MTNFKNYQTNCLYFNGYKPCLYNVECNAGCPKKTLVKESILIVHLGAMGAVLRSTSLLKSIKRKHPFSMITWVTEEISKPLLENNPFINRILTLSSRDLLLLSGLEFDHGYLIDKSPEVAGIIKLTSIKYIYGFTVNKKTGAILPASNSAIELWEIGLNNKKKFYENIKTEQQLVAESLDLSYDREEYEYFFRDEEKVLIENRRTTWSGNGEKILIGLNTGTSGFLPQKTIPVFFWKNIICKVFQDIMSQERLRKSIHLKPLVKFVLMGGGEKDQLQHQYIEKELSENREIDFILSPTTLGVRDGFCTVQAMDLIVTGDSLGMHMAIACKKPVIAWFGPSCSHEIDIYNRGVKINSDFTCSPCWKRLCGERSPCNENINQDLIVTQILKQINKEFRKNENCNWSVTENLSESLGS